MCKKCVNKLHIRFFEECGYTVIFRIQEINNKYLTWGL